MILPDGLPRLVDGVEAHDGDLPCWRRRSLPPRPGPSYRSWRSSLDIRMGLQDILADVITWSRSVLAGCEATTNASFPDAVQESLQARIVGFMAGDAQMGWRPAGVNFWAK